MKQVRRFIYLWITFLLLFTTFAFAFDSEGQNNRCPGEYIWTRSQYFYGYGALNNRAGDWRDVYRFRAPADGIVTISLYSRDAVDFKVGTYCPGSCSGQDITRKDNGSRYKSYSFRVKKGKTYYFTVFDGTWKFGYHTYSLSIKFPSTRRGTPPKINYIPNKTVLVNKSFSYYLRNYVRRTDGDRILGYELGGSLPPGVYFSRFSGILSGTPRRTGTYRLRFRARDKDGWSSYRYFYLIVIKKTPPYIKPIPDKTIILNKSFTYNLSNYVQRTEGDRILEYRLSGTLPSGLYFNRYTGIIRGTPRRTGTYKLSLKARDKDGWSNSRSFYIKVIKRDPPIIKPIPDQKIVVNTKYKFDLKSYVQPTDGDKILEYRLEGTLPKGLSFNKSSAYISGTPTVTGTYWLRFSARDKDGWSNRESFLITVTKPKYADAQDDSYEVRVGFKLRDNVLNNDTGSNLKVISHTNPSKGKLTINSDGTFTYEPTTKEVTYDSFKYTIIDKYGHKDSATVHLNITLNTQYEDIDSNDQIDFKIVNPPSTRNLPGNYLIIGNTSECLTTLDAKKTRSLNEILNAKCIDSYAGGRYGGNNGYIVRFIDIDGNRGIGAKTFNSTSANFTIPEGSEVVWAGLFWSAHFHSHQSYNPSYPSSQYYPKVTNGFFGFGNSSYQYINAKYDGHFDIRKTDANKVLIKLNGDKDYQVAQAIRLNYMSNFYTDHEGGPYSAYADITSWLKSHNIQPGKKYTLTVANVHATIGNDGNWMGEWGGWSAVIIYKNPAEHVKNITVYHGLAHIHGRKDLPDRSHLKESFTLSGFKLPKQGKVNGKLSLFSGEGEYNNYGDTMKIEGELPPGIPSSKKYNVFDGIIDKVSRDRISSTNPNNLKFANTMDIDYYDVSDILTKMRDKDPNKDSLTIEVETQADPNRPQYHDAFFISSLALSFDIYTPTLCYDYTWTLGEFNKIRDFNNEDRHLKFNYYGSDTKLVGKFLIKSLDGGNIVFKNAKLTISGLTDQNIILEKSFYSPNNSNNYYQVQPISKNPPKVPVGDNDGNINDGGTIDINKLYFSKLYFRFKEPFGEVDKKFNVTIEAQADFGSFLVPYTFSTEGKAQATLERCPRYEVYNPMFGIFNIERKNSKTQRIPQKYTLYTQAVNRPFDLELVSYDPKNLTKEKAITHTGVEVELIDADTFDNKASAGFDSVCEDYDKDKVLFSRRVAFPPFPIYTSRVGISNINPPVALKNAAFRIWYITDSKGDLLHTNCYKFPRYEDFDHCIAHMYQGYKSAGNDTIDPSNKCKKVCTSPMGKGCYECLKTYYGHPVCSRDNFAIRPVTFKVALYDNNQSKSTKTIKLGDNTKKDTINLTAGYNYLLDINATIYNSTTQNAKGYYQKLNGKSSNGISLLKFNGNSTCADKTDYPVKIEFSNGKLFKTSTIIPYLRSNNAGDYEYQVRDYGWTAVDQKNNPLKPYKAYGDCISENSDVSKYIPWVSSSSQIGCIISSKEEKYKTVDLKVKFVPYKFKFSNVVVDTNPYSGKNFLYYNDLTKAEDQIKNNTVMALKLSGYIKAYGANNALLTNFKNGCAAENVNITFDVNSSTPLNELKDSQGNEVPLQVVQYSLSSDDASNVIEYEPNKAITLTKEHFIDNGIGKFNIFMNFKRRYDAPINPIRFGITKVKASANNLKAVAMLNKDYFPTGEDNITSSKLFYYGAIKATKDFYDGVYKESIYTPIMALKYCDLTLKECSNLGIDINKSITSFYKWWLNYDLSTTSSTNKLYLKSEDTSKATVSSYADLSKGIDQKVQVKSNLMAKRPFIVNIEQNGGGASYLLYNPKENKPPVILYRVRFVNSPGRWSGVGKTGHATKPNSAENKFERMGW